MSRGGAAPVRLEPGVPGFPAALRGLAPGEAPPALFLLGDASLLRLPLTALFCSAAPPPELVLPAYDLARSLRDAGVPVIGGFHAPVERECLETLLRGRQPVVASPARSLAGMRLPRAWRDAVEEGRMLVVSRFEAPRRPDRAIAARRNRLVAALAERICVVHASPGGGLHRIAREALAAGKRVDCPAHPANRDLLLLGAAPLR